MWISGLGVWNLIVFITYGIDKRKAIRQSRRIRESVLLGFAWGLGAVGAAMGMMVFHHKTRKWKFRILIFLALAENALILYWIMTKVSL